MVGSRIHLKIPMVAGLLLVAAAVPSTALAQPGKHALRLEGAAAWMVGEQRDRFDLGGGFGASYELRFLDVLGIEARYAAFFFPEPQSDGASASFGGYQSAGGAFRLHPLGRRASGDLWLSAGANAVFTGDLTRFGAEAGLGYEFHAPRLVSVGPFVRYAHVFQPSGSVLGPGDGAFLQFGVSLAFSGRPSKSVDEDEEPVVEQAPEEPASVPYVPDESYEPPAEVASEPVEPRPRRDETPDEAAMRELSERMLFPHGDRRPTDSTLPELQQVAALIQAHPEWERVLIEGHASETGDADYNMRLSQWRAERVRELLIRHGVEPRRLVVVPYGYTRPESRGDSEEVHARNRRVVFTAIIRRDR